MPRSRMRRARPYLLAGGSTLLYDLAGLPLVASLGPGAGALSALPVAAAAAILVFGDVGRFVLVNAQACALTGYTHAELLARRIHDIVPADEVPELAERMSSLRAGPRTRERIVRRKDGTLVAVEVSAKQ